MSTLVSKLLKLPPQLAQALKHASYHARETQTGFILEALAARLEASPASPQIAMLVQQYRAERAHKPEPKEEEPS